MAKKWSEKQYPPNTAVTYDVVYGNSQVLDIYAAPQPGAITLVHVHGGAWCTPGGVKSSEALRAYPRPFAANGFCVIDIEYRTVPVCSGNTDVNYRDYMITDILAAMTWARANAATYNGSTSRIALWGESASSQLVLMATINGAAGSTRPDAVLAYSSFTRLDQWGDSTAIKNYLGISDDPSGAGAATARTYSPYEQWVTGIATKVRMCNYNPESLPGFRAADMTDMATKITSVGGTVVTSTINQESHSFFAGTSEFPASISWLRGAI